MSVKSDSILCPKCGIEMNHHAEKLVHPSNSQDVAVMDSALGGCVEQLHTCPQCGCGESRRVVSPVPG